jgi:hypothetical protein
VRYAVRHAIGREVDRLSIHVGALRYQPGGPPAGYPVAATSTIATRKAAAARPAQSPAALRDTA